MRIGFDAKRLYNNFTGLGNYSRFVVEALSKMYPENEYMLFTPRVKLNSDTQFFQTATNVSTTTPPHYISKLKLGSFWRSFLIGPTLRKENISVYHGLSHELPFNIPKTIRKIVTIHDLIFLRYPQFYNSWDVAIYKSKVLYACKTADKIIAISIQTRDDLIQLLSVDESKIEVVYQGCHPNFKLVYSQEAINAIREKYNLPQRYLLNVGTIEERKNLMLLVKAMALLPKESRIPLVVIGKMTDYYFVVTKEARKLGVLDDIKFLQNVPFNDFPNIYQGAQVFIYPSLFEGFGIPLIEAIESNVPVITSTGSCFREAAGPDSIYVDPTDEHELASQILNVLVNHQLREKMIASSKLFIEQFNPEIIARKLNRLYQM